MLTQLGMRNFKSWDNLPQMGLAPITGFFGANSSGKTSILQALLMLKQTVESPDRAQVLNFGDERRASRTWAASTTSCSHITGPTLSVCRWPGS